MPSIPTAELVEHPAEKVALTTNEHLAIRTWLNYTIFGKDRYAHGDPTTTKLLMTGVVDELRVLEMIHAERAELKGAAQRYDKFFADIAIDATGDSFKGSRDDVEDEEGEDA